MAAPTPPTGMSQAELDAMFANLRVAGEAKKYNWMDSQVPVELQPHWTYFIEHPSLSLGVMANTGTVSASPGILAMILVSTLGAGTLTLNDAPNLGAANENNIIFSRATADMVAGKAALIQVPFTKGLICSAFPAGGSYTAYYYTTPPS